MINKFFYLAWRGHRQSNSSQYAERFDSRLFARESVYAREKSEWWEEINVFMRRGRRAGNGLRYHVFSVCSCSLPIFDSSFRKLLKNIGAYLELVNRGMLALIASVVLCWDLYVLYLFKRHAVVYTTASFSFRNVILKGVFNFFYITFTLQKEMYHRTKPLFFYFSLFNCFFNSV